MGSLGHIFVSDVVQGKVYKVRANHYPANVTVEMDHLQLPIGVCLCISTFRVLHEHLMDITLQFDNKWSPLNRVCVLENSNGKGSAATCY